MAGYIGSKTSVAQVDGYTRTEADAGFVSDPNGAVTVDGSGNVGIGTTSPSEKLSIVGAGNGTSFSNTTASTAYNWATVVGNAGGSVKIGVDNNIGTAFNSGNYGGSIQSTNNLAFSAGGTERMRIDSAGRVTMPYQPAFSVHGVSFDSTTLSLLGPVVLTNVGGHFSTTTGRFTAPVAGVYGFSFVLSTGDANSHFVDLFKNGLLHGSRVLQYGSAYSTGANVQIIPLAAGDYVEARKRNESYAVYNAIFSGHLIG